MNRVTKSLRKSRQKKGGVDGLVGGLEELHTRTVNWSHAETDILLDSAQQIQLNRTNIDLNFTRTEFIQLHKIFTEKSSAVQRTVENIKNRLTTLKREYNLFHELAMRSGWSWCHTNHVPIPPDAETLREICQNDARYLYFDKKTFPWYAKMRAMCGGRLANGRKVRDGYILQHSTVGSGTDSSDSPRVEPPEPFETETVQWGPSLDDIATNDTPTPTSITSGSGKRKSNDGSSSRRDKIKKRISEKGKAVQLVDEIGNNMVTVQRDIAEAGKARVALKVEKRENIRKATQKLLSLNLPPQLRNRIQERFNQLHHVEYFLAANRDEIMDWIQPSQPPPAPPHQPYFPPNYTDAFFGFNPHPPPT